MPGSLQLDEDENTKSCLIWIRRVSMSPIAILILILMALYSLIRFLLKASLLFIVGVINTPFTMMCNVSVLVFEYKLADSNDCFGKSCARFLKSSCSPRKLSDPRAGVSIEVQGIVSDFFKVIAGEFLLVLSTGIITYYTAPRSAFYVSTIVGVAAILFQWLNTDSLSKTAISCLCAGSGLNPMMFLFSFLGLFDIGSHPIAKCSFVAEKAYLFVKDDMNGEYHWDKFEKAPINSTNSSIEFSKWDAFERSFFGLSPRIDFIIEDKDKYTLKSFMVLKLFGKNLCEYPVERLELSEDYVNPKAYARPEKLFNFLSTLSSVNGFVTDKMTGRYEHCLTLSEIVDGIQQNVGYRVVEAVGEKFLVAR